MNESGREHAADSERGRLHLHIPLHPYKKEEEDGRRGPLVDSRGMLTCSSHQQLDAHESARGRPAPRGCRCCPRMGSVQALLLLFPCEALAAVPALRARIVSSALAPPSPAPPPPPPSSCEERVVHEVEQDLARRASRRARRPQSNTGVRHRTAHWEAPSQTISSRMGPNPGPKQPTAPSRPSEVSPPKPCAIRPPERGIFEALDVPTGNQNPASRCLGHLSDPSSARDQVHSEQWCPCGAQLQA